MIFYNRQQAKQFFRKLGQELNELRNRIFDTEAGISAYHKLRNQVFQQNGAVWTFVAGSTKPLTPGRVIAAHTDKGVGRWERDTSLLSDDLLVLYPNLPNFQSQTQADGRYRKLADKVPYAELSGKPDLTIYQTLTQTDNRYRKLADQVPFADLSGAQAGLLALFPELRYSIGGAVRGVYPQFSAEFSDDFA
jgi:hypothetical protein